MSRFLSWPARVLLLVAAGAVALLALLFGRGEGESDLEAPF